MKQSIEISPYEQGFTGGYIDGNSAENPYVHGSESFRLFEEGKAEGNRMWHKKQWGVKNGY